MKRLSHFPLQLFPSSAAELFQPVQTADVFAGTCAVLQSKHLMHCGGTDELVFALFSFFFLISHPSDLTSPCHSALSWGPAINWVLWVVMEVYVLGTVCGRVHSSFCLRSKKKKKKNRSQRKEEGKGVIAMTPRKILQDMTFFLSLNLFFSLSRWIHLSSADYKLKAPQSKHLLLSFCLSLPLNGIFFSTWAARRLRFPFNSQDKTWLIMFKKRNTTASG